MDNILNNLNFIKKPFFSKKSSFLLKKFNTLVFKVKVDINKILLFDIIKKIFGVKIKKIRTLIIKGKKKNKNNIIGYTKKWKKVYVILKKGQNLKFNNIDDVKI